MSTKRKYIYSDQTGPKLNGQQLFFRTITSYNVDNNGKVSDPVTDVYYTPFGGGRASNGDVWSPGTTDDPSILNQGGFVYAASTNNRGKTFTIYNYTQADADAGRIPFGKNVGDAVLSPEALASLNNSAGVLNQSINNSVINTAVKEQSGLAKQLSTKLQNTDEASSPAAADAAAGAAAAAAEESVPITTNIPGKTTQTPGSYGNWIYPTGLSENKQDYIQFQMLEYGGRKNVSFDIRTGLSGRNIDETKILGSVFLPIQPSITDINSVDWQNDTINPLQLLGAQTSLAAMTGTFTEATFQELISKATDPATKSYLQQWAAGKAVGANIFSRFGGAVVNPNLELLFNGPQLRPFNFTFRLSPRDEPEARQVKGIIRFFKQGMSVRRTEQDIFLKAPNVFKIVYKNGLNRNNEHTSLNKFKICALSQCSVDYTPDGSYSTFSDPEATMTSYSITLQFNELEPIFNEDYENQGTSTIGY